jgi:hypothetical protein
MDAVAAFVSRTRSPQSSFPSAKKENRDASIPFPVSVESMASGVLVPMQRHLAAMRRQLHIGLLIGAAVATIVTFERSSSRSLHEDRSAVTPTSASPAQSRDCNRCDVDRTAREQ